MTNKWFVIVNPNAGNRKGKRDWPVISRLLVAANIDFTNVFTEHRGHAIKLTEKYIHLGFKNIIVVGGDGTLNEVVNGIFLQGRVSVSEIILAIIPVGTGNDLCRMYGISNNYDEAIGHIVRKKLFVQDTGIFSYVNSDNIIKKRYFANIAGMGFDALVAEKTNQGKDLGKSNPLSYYINIFTSLFVFKNTRTEITIDDQTISTDTFSMSVAIGQYNGGGMKQSPASCPNDGFFNMTIIRPIGKFKIIRNILGLLDGSFTKLPEVSVYKSAKIHIDSNPPLFAEADGESLGHTPFDFSILPQSLQIIVGNYDEGLISK